MDIKDRIKYLMDSQQMSQKEFAQYTGISEGSLSGVLNGRTRPTLNIVDSIHNSFPRVSISWLMFGQGDMMESANVQTDAANQAQNTKNSVVSMSLFGDEDISVAPPSPVVPANSDGNISRQVPETVVKYIDKPARKITEIRIFYDDQTWESFVPKQ